MVEHIVEYVAWFRNQCFNPSCQYRRIDARNVRCDEDAWMLHSDSPEPPRTLQEQVIFAVERHEDPTLQSRMPELHIIRRAFATFGPRCDRNMPIRYQQRGKCFRHILVEIKCRH